MNKLKILTSATLRLCGLILLTVAAISAQTIPSPKDVLGFTPGDDRKLASWAQTLDYFKKLDAASDRVMLQEIGKTTMGVPSVYATISSPENLKDLAKYREINDKLADPRKISGTGSNPVGREASRIAATARLIARGKTIVLITCGIHSDEVGSELLSMLIAYRLANSTDAETKKILDNTIILLVPSLNPDGVDIVKNWYDKTLGTPYEGTDPPELYNKYVGHDDNRDWYAFTQKDTQLVVDNIHNVWHPQIVHDIHQQGEYGSRLFLPPYMQPVEPNVPKQIVEGYTELGNYMAADLRKQGFQGITTDSTYDAWTPSRAYSHYHGGVRILSETASAKLATPITVKYDELRNGLGYDVRKETPNFGPVWKGGEWHLRDITNYMTTAAFSLLNHAADNREKWLSRFYEIGKEAVRPRKQGETTAYIIDLRKYDHSGLLLTPLGKAGIEYTQVGKFSLDGKSFSDDTAIIPTEQPYFAFAKAVLDTQLYPDLRSPNGDPIPPYDVTAHSLALLSATKIERTSKAISFPKQPDGTMIIDSRGCEPFENIKFLVYKSSVPVMDEGWTRWVIENHSWWNLWTKRCETIYRSIGNGEFRDGKLNPNKAIIFPDQSPNQILNGYAKGSMPDEYTGGVGKEGVENLKKFVEAGGTLVFLNRASDFAIEQFNLPIRDLTKGLPRKDFYIPGSILRTELDLTSPIAKGMPKESIAWFENGPVFEIVSGPDRSEPPASAGGRNSSNDNTAAYSETNANGRSGNYVASLPGNLPPADAGGSDLVRVIARYPSDPKSILLSGWALGAEKIAGKAALVEVTMGKGKIILFGFRPQYRGQSLATFPLLFNAISN
ncbi:MAG: M14 metallopeptidase family protein [Acidobacteriota bacterium]